MNWTHLFHWKNLLKWLAILLVLLLVNNVVEQADCIGNAPFSWYFWPLLDLLTAGLLFTVGKHLSKHNGNRRLIIVCYILPGIFLLASIYAAINLIQLNLNHDFSIVNSRLISSI